MIVDLFLVYQFIKRLATPFDKWAAYKEGVIDEKGNILKKGKDRTTRAEQDSFGKFDLMLLKLKKLLAKIPGGSSRLASYAAALWLIKEWNHFSEDSLLNESVTDKQLDESLDLFYKRYSYYINLVEDVNGKMLYEAKDKPPSWKRAGPNGELEIKFPTGRRFMIEKQLDYNERHKGDWKIMEWDTKTRDWEWHETYRPKWYAKENVMRMGQYDKKGKKVADYSSTFQSESVMQEEPTVNVGSGNIAGLGVGPQGEPGLTPAQMKKYKSKNKKKTLRDVLGST